MLRIRLNIARCWTEAERVAKGTAVIVAIKLVCLNNQELVSPVQIEWIDFCSEWKLIDPDRIDTRGATLGKARRQKGEEGPQESHPAKTRKVGSGEFGRRSRWISEK